MYGGYDRMARRITDSAERIRLPRRRRTPGRVSMADPLAPVLVRGRGLGRRRPQSPRSSPFVWLLVLAELAALVMI
jgi:hypothetical protein